MVLNGGARLDQGQEIRPRFFLEQPPKRELFPVLCSGFRSKNLKNDALAETTGKSSSSTTSGCVTVAIMLSA